MDSVLVRIIDTKGTTSRGIGTSMLYNEKGIYYGTVGGGIKEFEAIKVAKEVLRTKEDCVETFGDENSSATMQFVFLNEAEAENLYKELVHKNMRRCLIFGAGHVAQALAKILPIVDFECVIIDDREELCNSDVFPNAELHCVSYDSDEIEIDAKDFVCIMTRSHDCDLLVLRKALKSESAYIGVLGSKRKVDGFVEILTAEGIPQERIAAIYSPIGVDISCSKPSEIAVSIAAELINERYR